MTHFICWFYPYNKLLSRRFLWFRMVQDVGMLYSPLVTFWALIITCYQKTLLGASANQKRHYLKSYNNVKYYPWYGIWRCVIHCDTEYEYVLLNVREVYITFKYSHNVQHILTLKSMYCLHVNGPNVFLTCGWVNIQCTINLTCPLFRYRCKC